MSPVSPESRVEQALASPEPFPTLFQLATESRDAGMAQPDLQALFESFAARHQTDPDESRYDALVDTLDFIVGWCSPGRALYPSTAA